MSVPSEPFVAVYEDRNRLGVIVARTGRGGFEAFAADDHCLGGHNAACGSNAHGLLISRHDSCLALSRFIAGSSMR